MPGYTLAVLVVFASPLLLTAVIQTPLYATLTGFGASALFTLFFIRSLSQTGGKSGQAIRGTRDSILAGVFLGLMVLVRIPVMYFHMGQPLEIGGVPVMPPSDWDAMRGLIRQDINRYLTVIAPFCVIGTRELMTRICSRCCRSCRGRRKVWREDGVEPFLADTPAVLYKKDSP